MRKALAASVLIPAVLLAILLAGCGGGGSSTSAPTGATGVEAVGTMISVVPAGGVGPVTALGDSDSALLNPHYLDAFMVPSAVSVAVSKFELLKGVDDTTPFVVFDTGANLANAEVIDLTGNGASASFGENANYPAAGTYTHVRVTLVYFDMTMPMNIGDGQGYATHHVRVYASTVGSVLDGDVLMDMSGQLSWIQGFGFFPTTGSRPPQVDGDGSEVVQFAGWADDGSNSPDPLATVIALSAPVVIPANPTGQYVFNVSFDVTKSPEIAGSHGVFLYDDTDEDGRFEPAVDLADGGDNMHDEATGNSDFSILPPTITASFTTD